jgi:hypothetical protein
MVLEQDVTVIEIKADFDPFGGEYSKITLGYRVPVPMPPQTQQFPPQPRPVLYKHATHLYIPKENWIGQYTMWEQLHLVIEDNGSVKIIKKR